MLNTARSCVFFSLFLSLATLVSCSEYGRQGKLRCAPQKTPRYGMKWCFFRHHQSEIGSTCLFSCREGYHLKGPKVTKCIPESSGKRAYYNDTIGYCKENAPKLTEGINGPFLVHSYDPPTYVIHVGMGSSVTLKSYYFLALFVQFPGVSGEENTVSFLVQGTENKYIKTNGSHVYAEALDDLKSEDRISATFWLRHDRFFPGYVAFESCRKPNHFLKHQSRKIVLAEIAETIEDKACASFTWSKDL